MHGDGWGDRGLHLNRNLRVINTREVAGAGRLVLLWLEREGVGVHTRVRVTGVMVERLDLVEVLTLLLLEAVLAVKDKLEGVEGTRLLLGELGSTTGSTNLDEGYTDVTWGDERVGSRDRGGVGLEDDVTDSGVGSEIPKLSARGGGVGEAPRQFLDGVVVREANLLLLAVGNGVGTSVLNLLNEVLVTLLRETTTLLGVKVDVVSPHLEHTSVKVGGEGGREVNIDPHLVVLEGDEGQVETGVAVEEEDEGQVDGAGRGSGHLGVGSLLSLVEVQLGVQAPPLLVVLVNALTTDGQLNIVDRTLSNPVAVIGRVGGDSVSGSGLHLDVHVTDEITVTRNGDGHAAGVGGSTIDGLLDVLHREVSVALVFGLEESYLRVTGKVDILGTVSDELHKTASHFESCCTISREINFREMRVSRLQFFSVNHIMTTHPDEFTENPVEEGEIVSESESEISVTDSEQIQEDVNFDDDDEQDDGTLDIAELMTSLMATEDGDTLCSALVNIGNQLQTHNKIMIKILSKMNKA